MNGGRLNTAPPIRQTQASGVIRCYLHAADPIRPLHHAGTTRTALDLVNGVHAARHFSPDGVLAIQARDWREHDEELAIRAIGVAGACHAANAAQEARARRFAEFRGQVRQFGTTRASAGRVAALGHEAFNHAMEGHIVVKALPREGLDAFHMQGRQIGAQLDGHGAMLDFNEQGVFAIPGRGFGFRHRFWSFGSGINEYQRPRACCAGDQAHAPCHSADRRA